MNPILEFLTPIYFFALTGSYALLQNLQALGVTSIWHGPLIDLQGTISVISGGYFLFLLFSCLLSVAASAALSPRLSIAFLFIWLSPCILHSVGIYSFKPIVPEKYTIGYGGPDQLGLPEGAFINSITIVIISWSIATITLHAFRAGKRFKSFFDHIWYLFGISAVVFYVTDQSKIGPSSELSQAKSILQSSFSRLDDEFRRLNSGCAYSSYSAYPNLCAWSNSSLNYIERFGNMNYVEVTISSPPTIDELLLLASKQGISDESIKDDIARFNSNECKAPAHCRSLSVELNSHPDLINGDVGIYTKYALSAEAVMPTITRQWKNLTKLKDEMKELDRKENRRWVLLVFVLSILIGIKVSNSSRELFGGRDTSIYRKRVSLVFKSINTLLSKFICIVRNVLKKALQRTSR
ncbi:hypothetical protein [Stutzerimonas nitrititolerans]|uniref:hypothetical protein n=1 Tax=Stutzerimonas nitrititolerans TaxID=2482751 RepID=UPI00289892B1|nr:hypothetical protein [Stutzerimonas nitrititolerans]